MCLNSKYPLPGKNIQKKSKTFINCEAWANDDRYIRYIGGIRILTPMKSASKSLSCCQKKTVTIVLASCWTLMRVACPIGFPNHSFPSFPVASAYCLAGLCDTWWAKVELSSEAHAPTGITTEFSTSASPVGYLQVEGAMLICIV